MNLIQCHQGTPEWLQARAGVITASEFATAVSVLTRTSGSKKAGDPTGASDRYAADIAIERISGRPYGEPPKAWILERGHELEELARMEYEGQTGNLAEEHGVCKSDDGWFGYSTDGLVDAKWHGDSIIDSTKILAMWQSGDVSEYMHQMQGGMWLTGAKWCDFVMYAPDLEKCGKALYVKHIERDEEFIAAMELKLVEFMHRVMGIEAFLGMGNE